MQPDRNRLPRAGRALHEEPANIADPKEVWLRAHCIKCGHEWTI